MRYIDLRFTYLLTYLLTLHRIIIIIYSTPFTANKNSGALQCLCWFGETI